ETHFYIHQFIAREEPAFHCIPDSLFNRLDVFPWNRATSDCVFKDEALSWCRLNLNFDVTILTTTTRLFLIDFLSGGGLSDGFAIRHLRLADIRLNANLSLHAIDNDLKMQFAHARDNRLTRLLISGNIERRVFLSKPI